MILKDVLKSGFEFLGQRSSALLDCELILANVLGVDKEYLISHSDEKLGCNSEFSEDLIDLFWAYLKRVKAGEPVAYILREKEFYGLNFYVDNRALIPRPETEFLVERVLNYLQEWVRISRGYRTNNKEDEENFKIECDLESDSKKFKILDVGTGSGNIAIALAINFQNLEVTALDLSEEALEVARINIDQHGVEDRTQIFQSDLLEVIEEGEKYDVIVANLPYIGTVSNNDVEENVRKYEPARALFAGNDGLELYKKMFQQVVDKRVGYEIIIGEIGSMQRKDLELLLSKYFEHSWVIEKDLEGNDRMFVVRV